MYPQEMESVTLSVKEGPVVIQSLIGRGACNEYPLWNGILAQESFPPVQGSAYYLLTLSQIVSTVDEVDRAKADLNDALKSLAEVWVFAGGSIMTTHNVAVSKSRKYESDADEVRQRLLEKQSMKEVSSSAAISFETGCTYELMPLERAIALCVKARSHTPLRQIFEYYHKACTDRSNWFVHLYKAREVLKDVFGDEKKTKAALGISKDEWSLFGDIVNNYDRRHAPTKSALSGKIGRNDFERARGLAYSWVKSYLIHVGL